MSTQCLGSCGQQAEPGGEKGLSTGSSSWGDRTRKGVQEARAQTHSVLTLSSHCLLTYPVLSSGPDHGGDQLGLRRTLCDKGPLGTGPEAVVTSG